MLINFTISQLFDIEESGASLRVQFGQALQATAFINGSSVVLRILLPLDSKKGPLAPLVSFLHEEATIMMEGVVVMTRKDLEQVQQGQRIQPRMMSFSTETGLVFGIFRYSPVIRTFMRTRHTNISQRARKAKQGNDVQWYAGGVSGLWPRAA